MNPTNKIPGPHDIRSAVPTQDYPSALSNPGENLRTAFGESAASKAADAARASEGKPTEPTEDLPMDGTGYLPLDDRGGDSSGGNAGV